MSYKDYFELEDLAYEVQIGKRSLGDAVELAEMCLGVKLPNISHDTLSDMAEVHFLMKESGLTLHEYQKRIEAIIDFQATFYRYAENTRKSGKLTI